MLNNLVTPITSHDHTGSGKGRQIATAALAADAVDGSKFLLDNDQYARGRNNADTANINIIKVDTSDNLALGADIANFNIINNVNITGRNNADSANINIIKVNTSDKLAIGADVANLDIVNNVSYRGRNNADSGYIDVVKVTTGDLLQFGADFTSTKTFTIADNQSGAANVTGVLLVAAAGNTGIVDYKVYINATADLIEHGKLELSYDGTNWNIAQEFSHDDSLVTFSITAASCLINNL